KNLKQAQIVSKKIDNADIIYVGGGNTLKLMTLLRKYKVDVMLKNAYLKNKVLCGISAGAICWCEFGNSDSRSFTSGSNQLIKVKGLGLINILMCPHYNSEKNRQNDLPRMMKNTYKIPAIAVDDGAALVINGDKYKIITSMANAQARKCFWKKGEYFTQILEKDKYQDIEFLYKKCF
ncbi:MAG: Type 1 glutamine amidotransferase-like domain-containing protein, partial [Bacteroidales bacterium]|nr:Type 1 glutamine amidotransferase-like domain-containing protein [Bacteroidales bacterium]